MLLQRWAQLKSTRHYFSSYIWVNFIIGLPFIAYGTYVIFQLQQIGFIIGHGVDEPTCMTSCIVPFGSSELDMNAVILYLNGMGFAFGGFIMIFVAALADYWKQKSLLMVITMLLYAAISIPVAWLDKLTKPTFDAFSGLYVLFSVITLALMALLNIYIPFCMKMEPNVAKEMGPLSASDETERRYKIGTRMSVFGPILSWCASILVLTIGIVLSKTLEAERQQSAGLIMTTVAGFVTLAGTAVAYFGLPTLAARDLPVGKNWWSIAFSSVFGLVKDLWSNKTAAGLLVGYTAYMDTTFAQSSVLSQLFILTVKPDIVEFSLYSLSFNAMCIIVSLIWFWVRPKTPIRMRSWLIFGYFVNVIPALWGSIGISENVGIGFKSRWEFYVGLLFTTVANAIVNPVFRVVFSEAIPPKREVQWFGMQLIISCATTWVPYVVLAPFQQATNNLRYPLLVCFVFFCVPLAIELHHLVSGRRGSTKDNDSSEDGSEQDETAVKDEPKGGCETVVLEKSAEASSDQEQQGTVLESACSTQIPFDHSKK